jgi:DNA mismatch repair ATPase MutS
MQQTSQIYNSYKATRKKYPNHLIAVGTKKNYIFLEEQAQEVQDVLGQFIINHEQAQDIWLTKLLKAKKQVAILDILN